MPDNSGLPIHAGLAEISAVDIADAGESSGAIDATNA
jgi:hypothetical protein